MEKGIDKSSSSQERKGCQVDENEMEKGDQVIEGDISESKSKSDKVDDHEPISKYEEMRQKTSKKTKRSWKKLRRQEKNDNHNAYTCRYSL